MNAQEVLNFCKNCGSYLDFEEVFFKNLCSYCGSSQGFDLEDYELEVSYY